MLVPSRAGCNTLGLISDRLTVRVSWVGLTHGQGHEEIRFGDRKGVAEGHSVVLGIVRCILN